MTGLSKLLEPVLDAVKARNPNEPEFIQATEEILHTMGPVVKAEGGEKYIDGTSSVPLQVIHVWHTVAYYRAVFSLGYSGLVRLPAPARAFYCSPDKLLPFVH